MIVFDTETTGLIENIAAPLRLQPHIIELAAIKFTINGDEIDRWTSLMKAPVKLEDKVQQITGLNDTILSGAARFPELVDEITEFFLGEETVVGHNLTYDVSMLVLELRRIDRQYKFPFPPRQICTVEATQHMKGRRLKLAELHELLFGQAFEDAHSAMADAEATMRCVLKLMELEIIS